MFNVFEGRKTYGGKWSVKETRKFSEEEISMVEKAVVIPSQYGTSCCFYMKSGLTTYIPMSPDAKSGIGDIVNLREAEIQILEKPGNSDIVRIRG